MHADFDKVVLLNEHGHVSECTSANLFTIEGGRVSTPPLASSGCLPGVTRAVLLEEIRVPGFSIEEREISPADLKELSQVFMTSSTRDLLPVLSIDERPLKQDEEALGRNCSGPLPATAKPISRAILARKTATSKKLCRYDQHVQRHGRLPACGSGSIRLSRQKNLTELSRMALGTYPFRCSLCNHRFWANIWRWSVWRYAKGPRCLSLDLTTWVHKVQHLELLEEIDADAGRDTPSLRTLPL